MIIYLLLALVIAPNYQAELERYVADFLHPVRLMRDYEQRKADALMPEHFKSFDLTTRDGQIAAGVSFWRQSLDTCDTVEEAFNHYGTGGRCKPVYKFAKRRARHYRRAVKKYREGR